MAQMKLVLLSLIVFNLISCPRYADQKKTNQSTFSKGLQSASQLPLN